jgi:protein-S-isoprenylcysteine O-methyltransferase Ste14
MISSQKRLLASILPVTVLLIVPLTIDRQWSIASGTISLLGIPLIIAGLTMLFATVSLFSSSGEGTLAPWSPAKNLVIRGPYAYTRNPMISGVLAALLGESLLFQSSAIFLWFLLFFLMNNVYFSFFEEPGLLKRFGEEYTRYRKHVPRWIPRMTPWIPDTRPEPGTEKG